MTAESECVGQGDVYRALLRFVKSKVEVVVNLFVLILGVVIDGGGNDVVLHRLHAEEGFESSGGTEQVSGH